MTGMKFGRLTVVGFGVSSVRKNGRHNATFNCLCDCGSTVTVDAARLKNGNTTSCGCKQLELISSLNKTHGKSKTRLYGIWERIKQRCNNQNTDCYKYYGARGIQMCDEWMNSYEKFEEWAICNGYGEQLTIDRINTNDSYCPKNCRWVSRKVQANNRRPNRMISYRGKTQTLAAWSSETGIQRQTIIRRIDGLGWSVEDALTKSIRKIREE